MDDQATINTLIGIVPQILLILIIGIVLIALRRPIFEQFLPRISKVSLIGISVDLQPAEIRKELEARPTEDPRPLPSDAAIGTVADRAARNADILRGRMAVWIDDHPEWTRVERLVMHGLGVFVEPVRTTQEADSFLKSNLAERRADLIISDIGIDDGSSRLADAVRLGREHSLPVIFYVARARSGVPEGAFGITTQPDELWHLVMDAIERRPNVKG